MTIFPKNFILEDLIDVLYCLLLSYQNYQKDILQIKKDILQE